MKRINKKSSAILRISRFIVIALSIIAQAIISFVIFFKLNEKFIWFQAVNFFIGALLYLFIVNKDQSAVYKIPWMMLFTLFPVMSVIVYFTFGNHKITKKTVSEINSVFTLTNEEKQNSILVLNDLNDKNQHLYGQAKYLSDICNVSVYNDSSVIYLNSGEAFLSALLDQLKKAEEYIFLEYFIIDEGVMFNAVYEVLKEKVESGVEVFLSYDDVGSMPRVNRNFADILTKSGIKAVKFNSFVPVLSVVHNNRDHRKIAVIDGKVGFTGGVNIADEYINETKPFGRWKDSAVMIKGNAVSSLVKAFCQLYNVSSKNKINYVDYISNSNDIYSNSGYVLPYFDGPAPVYQEHIAENAYLNVINQAVNYLYITTPYLVVDNNIIDALKNAVARGVDVRIILPEIPDKKIVSVLTKSNYERLIISGVKIYEYKGGFIHSKTFVSDNLAIVGTVNLDYRSLVHHFENAVWMAYNSVVEDIKKDFLLTAEKESLLITKEKAKQNAFLKILKGILYVFSPLF